MASNWDVPKKKLHKCSRHNIMGLVHPYRTEYAVRGEVPVGTTVYAAIRQACDAAKVRRRLLNYGIAQIGRRDVKAGVTRWEFVPFSQWKKRKIEEDDIIRFRILPKGGGGGGGGKGNVLNTVLMIVVAVVAIAAAVWAGPLIASALSFTSAEAGAFFGALAGMAVLTIGQALVNAIAPVAAPSVPGISDYSSNLAKEPDVYSIQAARNKIDQWGRVPVPVGTGRFTPPKAAAPYTVLNGDNQFLHELFCLGIGDIYFDQIKIGNNHLNTFDDVQYEIMRYVPGSTIRPRYYPSGVYEEAIDITLTPAVPAYRTTQQCTQATIDFAFPNGLCYIDDMGKTMPHQIDVVIGWRKADGRKWNIISSSTAIPAFSGGKQHPVNQEWVLVHMSTRSYTIINHEPTRADLPLGTVCIGSMVSAYSAKNGRIIQMSRGYGTYFTGLKLKIINDTPGQVRWGYESGEIWTSTGTATNGATSTTTVLMGGQQHLVRKSHTINFPANDYYVIGVMRTGADYENTRFRDECHWTTLRSTRFEQPVKTSYPVNLLSLQIRATGQLSGSIDTLSLRYKTKCYDYNGSGTGAGAWTWQYTSNSASIMRYILQQQDAFSRPQANKLLDFPSFEKAHKHCVKWGFNYNKVLEASVSVFERLISVGASCLSSPTMIEGRWGIIVDDKRDNVVCAFTSANAWNWSFERTQVQLPNAIHCSFINETTWDQDMRVVPTDEPQTGQYIHETQSYDGVTSAAQVYRLARFHYADAKRRRRTITFKAYDTAILCTRGDLVELACPNVNVAGLMTGYVRKVNTVGGRIVSIDTDQLQTTDNSGRTFGVKIFSKNRNVYHAIVQNNMSTQRKIIFATPVTYPIEVGDMYAFGDYSEETFPAIILSMKFNSDWTCDITAQDYDEFLYGDLSKPIPDFESIITTPVEDRFSIYSVPIIVKTVSNETVMIRGADGSLFCRILVYLKDPTNLDPHAAYYQLEIREVIDANSKLYSAWRSIPPVPLSEAQVFISDVSEAHTYQIRARYLARAGYWGNWCNLVTVFVEGGLAPPPDVQNFTATIKNPEGIWLSWDMIPLPDIDYYRIFGAAKATPLESPYLHKPFKQVGLLEFFIVGVDRGRRESLNPTKASCTVYPPKDVIINFARLLNEGIVVNWTAQAGTWDMVKVMLWSKELRAEYPYGTSDGLLPFSGKFDKGRYVYMDCEDIFENNCANIAQLMITIYPPQTPQVAYKFDALNGKITLDWQDCKNTALPNTPDMSHYEITGTIGGGKGVEVKGTHYEALVPLEIYELGGGTLEDGVLVYVRNLHIVVTAVDKYGITSKDDQNYVSNEINIAIMPPYNPTDFGYSAIFTSDGDLQAEATQATAIQLTWRDCKRTFEIAYYEVYDSFTKTSYKVASNQILLPVRPTGTYPITVKAVDVVGLESATMTYNLVITAVSCMTVSGRVDGADILLEWSVPTGPYIIDHYVIFQDNDNPPSGTNTDIAQPGYIGQAKFNFYRAPGRTIGNTIYYIWAVDVAGNVNKNCASYVQVRIDRNPAPKIQAYVKGRGVELEWAIKDAGPHVLPLQKWEARLYSRLDSATAIPQSTPLEVYGYFAGQNTNVPALKVGEYTFAVRGLDTAGNWGDWGVCDFAAFAPGQCTITSHFLYNNNFQLYYTVPDFIFFPIDKYILAEYDAVMETHLEIGRVDSLFISHSEANSGVYTFSITPMDVAGNRGIPTFITLTLKEPAGFKIYDQIDSLFNGYKENMVLDGKGHMLGPYPEGETWEQNRLRASEVSGKDIITHKDKIDAGFEIWPAPSGGVGIYEEMVDHGNEFSVCNYSANVSARRLSGVPKVYPEIWQSLDGENWTLVAEDTYTAALNSFRYTKLRLTVTGGTIIFDSILITISLKQVTDYGRALCKADDNGEGWISEEETPLLTGTWVRFAEAFIDVQYIAQPNVVNSPGAVAFVMFEDVKYPRGFRCYVKDKDGNRITATVDWQAMGV